jgi:hypothetical protein
MKLVILMYMTALDQAVTVKSVSSFCKIKYPSDCEELEQHELLDLLGLKIRNYIQQKKDECTKIKTNSAFLLTQLREMKIPDKDKGQRKKTRRVGGGEGPCLFRMAFKEPHKHACK